LLTMLNYFSTLRSVLEIAEIEVHAYCAICARGN
jgi:hypothetical protein